MPVVENPAVGGKNEDIDEENEEYEMEMVKYKEWVSKEVFEMFSNAEKNKKALSLALLLLSIRFRSASILCFSYLSLPMKKKNTTILVTKTQCRTAP